MTTTFSGSDNEAAAAPTASDWQRLRQCESGGKYTINTGTGYYGAYQFDLSNWQSVGGTGYPHQASAATQDALALKLWQARGWAPWACASIVGLTGPRATPPIGFVDSVEVSGGWAYLSGWADDMNWPSSSIDVHIYVNSAGYAFTANKPRPDVTAVMGLPGRHGFAEKVPLPAGPSTICAYAIGKDDYNNTLLACKVVQGATPPGGFVDAMESLGRRLAVSGWAYDPNSAGTSIAVHVYVGPAGTATTANLARPDVNSVVGIPGPHGYSVTVDLQPGPNTVCAYGIGTNTVNNALIQCRIIQGPFWPIGYVDAMTISGSSAIVSGWAVDPNSSETSIAVHMYVNGSGFAFTANKPRPDVNSAVGIAGQHGFTETVPLRKGSNSICVYSIGQAANNNVLLQCRDVQFNGVQAQQRIAPAVPGGAAAQADGTSSEPTASAPVVPMTSVASSTATATATSSAVPATTGAPASTVQTTPTTPPMSRGALESLVMTGQTGTLTGWIADQSVGASGTWVRITVNGVTHDVPATGVRTDIPPSAGGSVPRGFTDSVTLAQGSNEVCLYEIDKAGGISSAPVTCRTEVLD